MAGMEAPGYFFNQDFLINPIGLWVCKIDFFCHYAFNFATMTRFFK